MRQPGFACDFRDAHAIDTSFAKQPAGRGQQRFAVFVGLLAFYIDHGVLQKQLQQIVRERRV
jgi:hypothetical protein